MIVRTAEPKDKLAFSFLADSFLKESEYPFSLDVDKLLESFEAAVSMDNLNIFLLEDEGSVVGMLAAAVVEPLFSKDTVATELAWYVSPDKRGGTGAIKLLDSYEKWAKDMGCSFVTMVDIDTLNSLEDLYVRKGYTLTEKTYVKDLK